MTTTDLPTHDLSPTIARYLNFWNTDPGEEQDRIAAAVFANGVEYVAPIGLKRGVDEVVALASEFLTHLGDVAFLARAEPEVHHDRARLRWTLIRGDEPFAEGTDVLVFGDDGRITSVTTFLDRAPEGFDPHAHD